MARKKARSVCANADLIASQGSLQEQQAFPFVGCGIVEHTYLAWGANVMTQVTVGFHDNRNGQFKQTPNSRSTSCT